jgi:hypothetical protein
MVEQIEVVGSNASNHGLIKTLAPTQNQGPSSKIFYFSLKKITKNLWCRGVTHRFGSMFDPSILEDLLLMLHDRRIAMSYDPCSVIDAFIWDIHNVG